jgi:phage terminase small subunit
LREGKPTKTPRPNRRDIERYHRFAEAYLDISNPETYLKADRSAVKTGYSKSFAYHRGYELLGRVGVQDEMKRIRDARLKSSTIATSEEVLEALTQQLRTLPNELVDKETGELLPLSKMTRDQA